MTQGTLRVLKGWFATASRIRDLDLADFRVALCVAGPAAMARQNPTERNAPSKPVQAKQRGQQIILWHCPKPIIEPSCHCLQCLRPSA